MAKLAHANFDPADPRQPGRVHYVYPESVFDYRDLCFVEFSIHVSWVDSGTLRYRARGADPGFTAVSRRGRVEETPEETIEKRLAEWNRRHNMVRAGSGKARLPGHKHIVATETLRFFPAPLIASVNIIPYPQTTGQAFHLRKRNGLNSFRWRTPVCPLADNR
jgi:hypothetical protein